MEAAKRELICSALPYCSNMLHLGNIVGSCLSADVYARYRRSLGVDVLFIGGCDCYGAPAMVAAGKEGTGPRELCVKYIEKHRKVCDWFGISFDIFGDTMTQAHSRIAQSTVRLLQSRNKLIVCSTDQYYSEASDMFLPDRFVAGTCPYCKYTDARGDQCDKCGKVLDATELISPKCTVDGTVPVLRDTAHLYLDMTDVASIKSWYAAIDRKMWSPVALSIMDDIMNRPHDGMRCITRDLSWGVPLPDELTKLLVTRQSTPSTKTLYVWFEAVLSYISMVEHQLGVDGVDKWWNPTTRVTQFHAKDNVYFHAMLLPYITFACGVTKVVDSIQATNYLLYEGEKFSKSRGVGVFGDQCPETGIDADVYRWYLCSIRPETDDSNFSWSDMQAKVNAELVNNIGNLVNRVLQFSASRHGGKLSHGDYTDNDTAFCDAVRRHVAQYHVYMNAAQFRGALSTISALSTDCNNYMQTSAPWKQPDSRTSIYLLVNAVFELAYMLDPFMPRVNDAIYKMLNAVEWRREQLRNYGDRSVRQQWVRSGHYPQLSSGHTIGSDISPVFRKITDDEVIRFRQYFGGKQDAEPRS